MIRNANDLLNGRTPFCFTKHSFISHSRICHYSSHISHFHKACVCFPFFLITETRRFSQIENSPYLYIYTLFSAN